LSDGIGDTIRVARRRQRSRDSSSEKAGSDDSENIRPNFRGQAVNSNDPTTNFPSIHFLISGALPKRFLARNCRHRLEGVRVAGEELMRVVVRQGSFDKVSHKIERLGDYQTEIIYERAKIAEVDPRDDRAIAELNKRETTQP
jgi:hypothetical protein